MALSELLEQTLDILKPYLKKKNIVEICINEPGLVWMEKTSGKWNTKKMKNLP